MPGGHAQKKGEDGSRGSRDICVDRWTHTDTETDHNTRSPSSPLPPVPGQSNDALDNATTKV